MRTPETPSGIHHPWEVYGLVGGLIAHSALILLGNTPALAAWLLTLLAVGVGQALLLPTTAASAGWLATGVGWVLLRQAVGVWEPNLLLQSLAELGFLSLNVALAIQYSKVWQSLRAQLATLRELENVLVGDGGAGLFSAEVAMLRLKEEVDRALLFQRPIGLLLAEVTATTGDELPVPATQLFQAIARQLNSAAAVHDIPFRLEPNRFGIILPERDWQRLYADAEVIVSALKQASTLDPRGEPLPVRHFLTIDVGLGVYAGEAATNVDLLRAAEDSLEASRDLAALGEAPLTAYAMPAAPVQGARAAASDDVQPAPGAAIKEEESP